MNKPKILVVGGAGYVGGYLVDLLLLDNNDIIVYDNLCYEKMYLKDVRFIYGDIRERDKLKKILDDMDIVIWLAAIVGDGACAINPELSKEINEDSVKWLVDNFKGKIIFTSTCSVYGINNDLIDENTVPNPLSVYAKTKLNAELYIREHCKDYLIYRLGTLYGIGDLLSRIRLDLVVNILTTKAVKCETLKVFGGDQWRPLLHVRNVAQAIIYGIDKDLTGFYNLAEKNYTIKQIAEKIQSIIPNTKVEYTDLKFEDQRNYKVSIDKILSKDWHYSLVSFSYGINQIKKAIEENRIPNINDPIFSNVAYLKENISNKL